MQSKISFSNSSFNNLNKYIKPDNQNNYSSGSVAKSSPTNNIENIDLYSSNINGPTITISNINGPRPKNPTVSAYSITSHSDKDNVNINQIRSIIRDAKNEFKSYQSANEKTDFDSYSQNILQKKYGLTEKDAATCSRILKKILLDSTKSSDISDIYSNTEKSNLLESSYIKKYLEDNKDDIAIGGLLNKIGSDGVNDILSGYKKEYIDYLELYYDYLKGRTLYDAMKEENYDAYLREKLKMDKIATYDSDYEYKKERFEKVKEIFKDSLNSKDYDISYELKKSKVVEVVDENGYDAMVLELTNGNYAIVNSCTNEKEQEDLAAIIGSITNLACDDEFSKKIFETYTNAFFDIKSSNANAYSNAQVSACEKTIKKYANQGKNLELYGYSLGGGIMEAAYGRILNENNSKYTDKINSVCVYNPFTLIAEEDSKEGIKKLAKDKKFLRYCAEGDVVSTFNNYVEELDNNTLYLKAAPINSQDWFEQRGKDNVCKPTELFTKGNHAFSAVNGYKNSSFDEYGNVTKNSSGEYVSISNVIRALTFDNKKILTKDFYEKGDRFKDYKEKYNSKNLNECMKMSFPIYGNLVIKSIGFDSKIPSEFEPSVDEILKSFGDNFGHIKYSDFSNIIGSSLADYIYDQTEDIEVISSDGKFILTEIAGVGGAIVGSFGGPGGTVLGYTLGSLFTNKATSKVTADDFIDEDKFKSAIEEEIANSDTKVFQLINAIVSDDKDGAENAVDSLVEGIVERYYDTLHDKQVIKKCDLVIDKLDSNLKEQITDKLGDAIDSMQKDNSSEDVSIFKKIYNKSFQNMEYLELYNDKTKK